MKRIASLVTTMALIVSLASPVVADEGDTSSTAQGSVDETTVTTPDVSEADSGTVVVDEEGTSEATPTEDTSDDKKAETSKPVTLKKADNTVKSENNKSSGEEEEPVEEPTDEVVVEDDSGDKEESKEDEKPVSKVKDYSDRVVKDGMNVKIYAQFENPEEYVPSFKLYLSDTKNKIFGETVVGKQNYNVDEGAYIVKLKHSGYKKGDKFRIHIREADKTVKTLTLFSQYFKDGSEELTTETWEMKNNQYFEGTVRVVKEMEDDETESLNLNPSEAHYITGELKTNQDVVIVDVEDSKGNAVTNSYLNLEFVGGKQYKYKTDGQGKIWLDKAKFSSTRFLASMDGYRIKSVESGEEFGDYSRSTYYEKELAEGYTVFNYVVDKKTDVVTSVSQGSVGITPTVKGNTELTDLWVNGDLIFKDGKGEEYRITVDSEKATLALPNGNYTVSSVSKNAKITLNKTKITVKDNKVDIGLTFEPKYIFEVGKQGQAFKFKVVNVPSLKDKVFSGKGVIQFGVVSGQSFMVQDLADNKIYSVVIDDNSTKVTLVLGVGVVFGSQDAINPHTGDAIIYLTILLMFSLVASGIFFFLYRKGTSYGNKALASVLIFGLVSSTFVMGNGKAEAAVGGTVGSGSGGSATVTSSMPKGTITTLKDTVLQVSLIPSDSKTNTMKENSTVSDLDSPHKFGHAYVKRSFFIAPNESTRKLFLHSKSSYAVLNEAGKINTIYGKHPFSASPSYYNSARSIREFGIKGSLKDRTFNLHENHSVFGDYISRMVQNLGATTSGNTAENNYKKNQQLYKGYGSTSIRNIGSTADNVSKQNIYKWLNSKYPSHQVKGHIQNDSILFGYIEKLEEIGQMDEAAKVRDYVMGVSPEGKEYAFMFQTLQGFQVQGKPSLGTMFMPLADAVRWYKIGREETSSNNKKYFSTKYPNNYLQERLMFMKRSDGKIDNGYHTTSNYAKIYPLGDYLHVTRPGAVKAIKPKTSKVPIKYPTSTDANIKTNPFAGWGFLSVVRSGGGTIETGNDPALNAVLKVKYKDKDGKDAVLTEAYPLFNGGTKIHLDKYLTEDKLRGLELIVRQDFKSTKSGSIFKLNNKDVKVYVKDSKDSKDSLLKQGKDSKGNVDYVLKKGTKGLSSISFKSPKNDDFLLRFGTQVPTPLAMYTYLNGWGSYDTPESRSALSIHDSKYTGKNFSNATLTIEVSGEEIPRGGDPKSSSALVPEWRLSKYTKDIAKNGTDKASFELNIPSYAGYAPRLSPSGNTTFSLVNPSLKDAPWAISKAKKVNGESYTRLLGVTSYLNTFAVTGDLLAIKDNSSIGGVKLASWKNNFDLFNGKIGTTTTGFAEDKKVVTKNYQFAYGVKSPSSSYTLYSTSDLYDKDGKYTGSKTNSYSVGTTYSTAKYNTAVQFDRHIPSKSKEPSAVKKALKATNGKYWETYQDKQVLNVNPEVAMAYDDVTGNTSVAVVAGDQLRKVKPIHFNVAQFRALKVEPKLEGMSVATDVKAKALAKKLGAQDKGVVYKGASTTTNFGVQGEMVLKTFALDIGSSSLKNVWSNSTYSTDKVNEEFLARHATKKPDGTWELPIDASGKLKINGKEYGGQNKKLVGKQKNLTTREHTLVVRGGKLVAVNGNYNLSTLDSSLKEALTRMNISTARGTNVFSDFASRQGAKVTGDSLALDVMNLARAGDHIKANEGWYNEDTTVLVVREYINTFELPNFMYVDKVPMEIAGLETPIDKMQYFTKGYVGHTILSYKVKDVVMKHDSSSANPIGGKTTKDYVVPNVSVLDSVQF